MTAKHMVLLGSAITAILYSHRELDAAAKLVCTVRVARPIGSILIAQDARIMCRARDGLWLVRCSPYRDEVRSLYAAIKGLRSTSMSSVHGNCGGIAIRGPSSSRRSVAGRSLRANPAETAPDETTLWSSIDCVCSLVAEEARSCTRRSWNIVR